MQDLGGKIAFVTGGSIGLGLVKVLAAAGMKVGFAYRQRQHRDEAERTLGGSVPVLINNAGVRPAQLAESGYATPRKEQGGPTPEFMLHAMDAVTAAGYVLESIRHNRLFILSHPEFRDVRTARSNLLLDSTRDEPINEARANSACWILSKPVYENNA